MKRYKSEVYRLAFLFIVLLLFNFVSLAAEIKPLVVDDELLTFDFTTSTIKLTNLDPGQGSYIISRATNININAREVKWKLYIEAEGDLVNEIDQTKIPLEKFFWALRTNKGSSSWKKFKDEPVLVVNGHNNKATDQLLTFDYKLELDPEVRASSSSSAEYKTSIRFTLTEGEFLTSFAFPNPFSPDGDGINDQTTISFNLGQEQMGNRLYGYVLDQQGELAANLWGGTGTVFSSEGTYTVTWDGKGLQGEKLPAGVYYFVIGETFPVNWPELDWLVTAGMGTVEIIDISSAGSAGLEGKVIGRQEGALPAVEVSLFNQQGQELGRTVTDERGYYRFSELEAGAYYLLLERENFWPYRTSLIYLTEGEIRNKNFTLDHNSSLFATIKADKEKVSTGDIITYRLNVENIGTSVVEGIEVAEFLPDGLSYLLGSSRVNGEKITDRGSDGLNWELGTLARGETATLTYSVVVNPAVEEGIITNQVVVSGLANGDYAGSVQFGPLGAPVLVENELFSNRGAVAGYIGCDRNNNQIIESEEVTVEEDLYIRFSNSSIFPVRADGSYLIDDLEAGLYLAWLEKKDGQDYQRISEPEEVQIRAGLTTRKDLTYQQKNQSGKISDNHLLAAGAVELSLPEKKGMEFNSEFDLNYQTDVQDWRLELLTSTRGTQGRESLLQNSPVELIFSRNKSRKKEQVRLGSIEKGRGINWERELDRGKMSLYLGEETTGQALEEIPLDQYSGPYQLAHQTVIPGSEKVKIKTYNSQGRLIAEISPAYYLDYKQGRIYLKTSLPLTDYRGYRRTIEVTYQYQGLTADLETVIVGGDWKSKLGNKLYGRIRQQEAAQEYQLGGSYGRSEENYDYQITAGLTHRKLVNGEEETGWKGEAGSGFTKWNHNFDLNLWSYHQLQSLNSDQEQEPEQGVSIEDSWEIYPGIFNRNGVYFLYEEGIIIPEYMTEFSYIFNQSFSSSIIWEQRVDQQNKITLSGSLLLPDRNDWQQNLVLSLVGEESWGPLANYTLQGPVSEEYRLKGELWLGNREEVQLQLQQKEDKNSLSFSLDQKNKQINLASSFTKSSQGFSLQGMSNLSYSGRDDILEVYLREEGVYLPVESWLFRERASADLSENHGTIIILLAAGKEFTGSINVNGGLILKNTREQGYNINTSAINLEAGFPLWERVRGLIRGQYQQQDLSGIIKPGLEAGIQYQLKESLELTAGYRTLRLIGDDAQNPLLEKGPFIRLSGYSYRF